MTLEIIIIKLLVKPSQPKLEIEPLDHYSKFRIMNVTTDLYDLLLCFLHKALWFFVVIHRAVVIIFKILRKITGSLLVPKQGDQIGRNFAIWAIFYGVGRMFFLEKVAQ